jgi:uncharacterized membrane protein YbhN (UPF0104 family)
MNEQFINPSNRSQLIRWVGTILAVILLVYLLSQQGWQEFIDAFQKISVYRLLIALGIVFVSRFAVITRWYVLLRATDQHVSWYKTVKLTFAGLFASNFLPTTIGGDVVRFAGALQLRIDGAVSAASLVVDRLVGMTGMALMLPLSVMPVYEWFATHPKIEFGILSSSAFLTNWIDKGKNLLQRVLRALSMWRNQTKVLLFALFFTIIHQLCIYVFVFLLLGDLSDNLSFGMIAGLWSLVYFVTLLPISINGYGVQEISFYFIFTSIGNISISNALTISLLYRFFTIFASLPGVVFISSILVGHKASIDEE